MTADERPADPRTRRAIARALAGDGALRAGLGEDDAADLVHALLSPELSRLLVVDRHWEPGRYGRWLGDLLAAQLLRPADDHETGDPADPPPTS